MTTGPVVRALIGVSALVSLLSVVALSRQDETSPAYAVWGNPEAGRQVYAEKGCGRCHAINGIGPAIGPDLGRPSRTQETITQMAGILWNHAPTMQKVAKEQGIQWHPFHDSEMRDLIAYLIFLRILDQPGDPGRGQRLFYEKHCSACHALNGQGGGIGPDLTRGQRYGSPILWAQVMWQHAAQMEVRMRQMGLPWPKFEGNEMVDLIAFIQSQQRSEAQSGSAREP